MDNLYSVTLGTALGGNGYTRRHVIAAAALTNTPVNRVRVRFQSSGTAYTITDGYIGLQAASGDAYDIDPATLVRLAQGGNTTLTITSATDLSDLVDLEVDGTRAVVVSLYGATSQVYLPGSFPAGYSAYHKLASDAATANATGYSTTATNIIGFRALEGAYVPNNLVRAELVQLWGDAGRIVDALSQPWGVKLGADLRQPWGDAPALQADIYQPWGDASVARVALVQSWRDMAFLRAALQQPWHTLSSLITAIAQPWAISSGPVLALLEQGWTIRDIEQVLTVLHQPWTIAADSEVIGYQVSVESNGMAVRVGHVNIEADLGQDVLTCEIHPGTEDDYLHCPVGAELTITTTAGSVVESYLFVITSRRVEEQWGQARYIVEAMSPAALLGDPWATPIDGELSGMASKIASTLAGSLPVSWKTVDWHIPAATWIAAQQTPLALLKQLASAVGAVVQSRPDGWLMVLPEYPLSVPSWTSAVPDAALTEIIDCATTGSTPDHRPGHNVFLVSDQVGSADTLRLEETAIGVTSKEVRGYQTPWSGSFSLMHSGGAWVQIEDMGIEERQVTETIEIVGGSGRAQYPIYSRDAVDWMQTNLGSVTFSEDGGCTADISGQSLLNLTYTTRCRLWKVRDAKNEQLQLVATHE